MPEKLITIGVLAKRTGTTVSALRFYNERKLIESTRTSGGKRLFRKEVVRRVSFILIAQQLGYTLEQIHTHIATLPSGRTPTKKDWEKLSSHFRSDLDERIEQLTRLRDSLTSCIGCGCLSLSSCRLHNPNDRAGLSGPGARYLLGESPVGTKPLS